MPPPTQFGGLFFGGYTGLTADLNSYPVWMDTRNPELFVCPGTATATRPPGFCTASGDNAVFANDQEIYIASVGLPGPDVRVRSWGPPFRSAPRPCRALAGPNPDPPVGRRRSRASCRGRFTEWMPRTP
jgi:hypothetical protein